MPYTKSTKERPRKDQAKEPNTPGELTLAFTVACLEYIDNTKADYANMARCMVALDPGTDSPTHIWKLSKKIDSVIKLRRKIETLAFQYIARQGNTDYYMDVRASKICAQHEWYRKMMVPYEDFKCYENGEVYPVEKIEHVDPPSTVDYKHEEYPKPPIVISGPTIEKLAKDFCSFKPKPKKRKGGKKK